ncbi:hypothetical protein BV20DRAFT_163844 [Pilatotrama ljubarskyi]|nr:hypothetical protein BV20DRAFT_163844 [Pilatotrama ljubarskyi]
MVVCGTLARLGVRWTENIMSSCRPHSPPTRPPILQQNNPRPMLPIYLYPSSAARSALLSSSSSSAVCTSTNATAVCFDAEQVVSDI